VPRVLSRAPSVAATAVDADPAGVLAVDKPSGWTSHDVVAVVRGALRVKRVGHGGTLDPLATGLLPVLVGRATRSADRLHAASKVYAALVRFGAETATDDAEGAIRREAPPPRIDAAALDAALGAFRGKTLQVPPDFAAVKIQGRRAYDVARAGEEVRIEPRAVRVERLAVASWDAPSLRLLIVCGSGTYIRSLARDIGRALGSAAHLAGLRRLAVGALSVESAVDPGRVRAMPREATVTRLLAVDDGLLELDPRYRAEPADRLLAGWGS
jgi:tRNA pseudouridine55 synthase